MDHDDTVQAHFRTALVTAANNQRQHLNRQLHAQGDAESRAFYAEQGQQRAEQALQAEQQEHAATCRAMTRLLAQNIGLRKSLAHLGERYATHEGKTVEELREAFAKDSKRRGEEIFAHPDNDALLRRDVDILRNAERLIPK